MTKALILLFFFLNISKIYCQQTAMFEMPIYFSDAHGNRDTIIIGGDTTAALGLNPQFGEVPCLQPFDSIFEVRVCGFDDVNNSNEAILLKKIIGWTEPVFGSDPPCDAIEAHFFIINAKYLPVTISWDADRFTDSFCISESYISSSLDAWLAGEWVFDTFPGSNVYYCMSSTDSISINFGDGLYTGNMFNFEYPIEGGQFDTLIVAYVVFSLPGLQGPCDNITLVPDYLNSPELKLYPNPAFTNSINLYIDGSYKKINAFTIFNAAGQVLIYNKDPDSVDLFNIRIDSFPPGIYFVSLHIDNFNMVKKFAKVE